MKHNRHLGVGEPGGQARRLRLVQVVPHLDGGGLETLVGELIEGGASSGIDVSVITLTGHVGKVGERVSHVTQAFYVLRPFPVLSMLWPLSIIRALRKIDPDVVHLHSGCWFKGALAARLAGVPRVIFTEHGREHDDPPLARFLDRVASRWTDVVVAVSGRLGAYLVGSVGVSHAKVVIIENGVDAERFAPGPKDPSLLASIGVPSDSLVVGSIGRLEQVKAYERLIDAVALLGDTVPRIHVVLCGDGSERARLEARARDSGVAAHFPGWVQDTHRYYRLFDVFALTSISEGLSVSLLEAMATGAAPAVTDVGANRYVLGAELAGQVADSDAPEEIARCIGRALVADERVRLGELARRRVLERFDRATMLERYSQIYNEERP